MKKLISDTNSLSICALLILFSLGIYVYWPGLSGPFLFDDFANLETLGDFNSVSDLKSLVVYLTSGIAGPTGRPIALLSFLLNDCAWPSEPWSFKYTNLMIHLLNGLLLMWIIVLLGQVTTHKYLAKHTIWIAIGVTSLWLLHPMHVGTVLYVVQRMSLLAAMFSLLGIMAYVKGRITMQYRPAAGYWVISLSVPLFTLLALLSKENGVLLPILLMVIEFTALRHQTKLAETPTRLWTLLWLGLPSIAVLAYLGHFFLPEQAITFQARGYTLTERLLTESRAVVHYLYDLVIPKLYSGSLFNDDFVISQSLITPYTTSCSIIFIAALIGIAVKACAKYPLASLGILFFFCGHLLESTAIPLDIYYEHRNYLPSVFLFLPLAYLADLSPKPTLVAATSLALLMSVFTAAKAKLWRSEPELLLLWSSQHPDSVRAQRYASTIYFKVGDYDRALNILDSVILKHPADVKTRLHQLVFLCSSDRSGEEHLNSTIAAIHATPVHLDGQLLEMLEQLVTSAGQQKCPAISLADIDKLIDAVIGHLSNTSDTTKYFVLTHIKGMIALYRHDPSLALDYFSRTLAQSRNPETGLLEAAMLASNGYLAEAEEHINSTDELFKSNPDRFSGITARHNFADEIAYLRHQVQGGTK